MQSMDELDWKILNLLQNDPEKNYSEIGKELAPDPAKPLHRNTIINRVKKLRQKGILNFPTCIVDPVKIGFRGVGVICVKMKPLEIENATKTLASFPEVICLGSTMGAFDIAFQVVTKDTKELQKFINNHVRTLPGFVSVQISTFVEMYKNTHKISLLSEKTANENQNESS
ncbi:MAG: Lrp/AsnC family transcriptional regulator [Candidatus Heimdallarchaeota archaeon]